MFGNGRRLNFGAPVVMANAPPATPQASPPSPAQRPSGFNPSKKLFTVDKSQLIGLDESREQRSWRMSYCGTWHRQIVPKTGDIKSWQYRCGCWRDGCPTCLTRRARNVEGRMRRAIEKLGDDFRIVQRSKKDATKFIRKLGKRDKYLRVPTEDGDLLFFDGTDHNVESDLEPDDIDWEEVVRTPEKRRMSGSLGKPPKSDKPEDESGPCMIISVPDLVIEPGEGHTLSEAWLLALEETADLDPMCDREELERATQLRTDAFKQAVIHQGGHVVSETFVDEKVWINSYTGWDPIQVIQREAWRLDRPDEPF